MSILVQVPSSGRNHKAVAGRAIKRRSSESESGKRCPWILHSCNYSAPQTRQAPRSSACFKGVLWSNKGTLFHTKKPVDMTKIVVKIIRLRLANGRQCNLELLATRFSQSLQLLLTREISNKGMTEPFKARIILEPMPRSDTGIPKFWMYLKPGHCTAKVNCWLETDYIS